MMGAVEAVANVRPILRANRINASKHPLAVAMSLFLVNAKTTF